MAYIDYTSELSPTAWEVFLCLQEEGYWDDFSENIVVSGTLGSLTSYDWDSDTTILIHLLEGHKDSESFEDTLRKVLLEHYNITLVSKGLDDVLLEKWDTPYCKVAGKFHKVVKATYEAYNIPEDDKPMKREAWCNLVDSYYKEGTGIPDELRGLLPSLNNLDDPIAD